MCGIFFYYAQHEILDNARLMKEFMKIQPRGPDNSNVFIQDHMFVGFHRLAINDLSFNGMQPMHLDKYMLICNGEIYNYKQINSQYKLNCTSNSDCETILQLYKTLKISYKNNIEKTIDEICRIIDGEYAFIIYDKSEEKILICRDKFGVRPLFIAFDETRNCICLASELKAIDKLFVQNIEQFPPSAYCIYDLNTSETIPKIYNTISEKLYDVKTGVEEDVILPIIRDILIKSVVKRSVTSERPICALLSGGLDSSLVCGILHKYCNLKQKLHTFSIGIKGSSDLLYARKVAEFISSDHHEVHVTADDMLNEIENVIKVIESYDTTTVRASIPHYLIANYIKNTTDFKVVFSGEMSDEQMGGYLYFKNAPSPFEFHTECNRLLEEVCYFDNLRADRCISNNGLEARVPFSDSHLVKLMQSVDPLLRMCKGTIEKGLLRRAFENDDLIPPEVLFRQKEAFSDGVSNEGDSWYKILQRHIDTIVTDEEFLEESIKIKHCTPDSKESYYYRKLYSKHYTHQEVIPHFWKPMWVSQSDPSARELKDIY